MRRETRMAAPVSFIRWILIMAPMETSRRLVPRVKQDRGRSRSQRGIFSEGSASQPRCGIGTPARPQGGHDALLHSAAPLSRLARCTRDAIDLAASLSAAGVDLAVIQENVNTR